MTATTHFYGEIGKSRRPLHNVLADDALFRDVPEDWQVIVVDVEGSTQAVKNGLHHQVNLAATGSIVAVLNAVKAYDEAIKVPYFFGGDGATFLVPGGLLGGDGSDPDAPDLLEVLDRYRQHVLRQMYLTLRVGALSVAEVYDTGRAIRITKFAPNDALTIPLVLGAGLKYAERTIKGIFIDETVREDEAEVPDLTGMECRWQEIAPPEDEDQVVCLVIDCEREGEQARVYADAAAKIDEVLGDYAARQPITVDKLKLNLTIEKIKREMRARTGNFDIGYLLKNWLITVAGKFYFTYFKEGREYVEKVSQLSYTLMLDGTFNCVLSGTPAEIATLREYLDLCELRGELVYGIHATHASVMSCYVEDRKAKHIHFVDGTEGGFTTAAKMFKAKLAVA